MDVIVSNDKLESGNQRIEFIDAMRGFTMILVVVCHVSGFCLGIGTDVPSIHPFLYEFRMPTFFFISGFVLYKSTQVWNMGAVLSFLKKKFPVQIVTTSIFFLIFIYLHNENLIDGLFSDSKLGYWFTYTLFFYFIFYSLSRCILQALKCNDTLTDSFVFLIGTLFYFLFSVRSVFYHLPLSFELSRLLSMQHWGYFLFFTIGTLFKKYYSQLQLLLDTKPIIFVCLVLFFGGNIFYQNSGLLWNVLFNLSMAICGIVLVFSFFRINQSSFAKEKPLGKCLQYMGRRTLDIYLLHYFLLPTGLLEISGFLRVHPMPILEFVITLVISLIIIGGCLILSNILRMSPAMTYLLFGVKKRK